MSVCVRWLEEVADEKLARVGGKALNLARLCRAGFEVPRGFVLSAIPRARTLPPQVADELRRFYREMGEPPVAVRSSAVAEDSSAASFAGQGLTVLNVRGGEELLEAVAKVCRSMDEGAARSYASRRGLSPEGLTVHVVVQEMVDARAAGVLFTANPVSGRDDEILINATWGLGEPLVSGKITPDELVVAKSTGELRRSSVGGKSLTMTLRGCWPTPGEKASCLCLDAEQIRRLAEVAVRIEREFGGAQDIEWAWDGGLRILQTRPLTARAGAPQETPSPQHAEAQKLWQAEIERLRSTPGVRAKVWVAGGMAELLPCPTPLSWEVASRLMSGDEGYGLAQRRLGFDPAPGTVLALLAGHVYLDLDRESGLFFRDAPVGYDPGEMAESPRRAHLPATGFRWRKLGASLLLRWPLLLWRVLSSVARQRRLRREFPAFFEERWLPTFLERVRETGTQNLADLEPAGLLAEFENRLRRFLLESAPVLMTGSILSAMAYRELEDLLIGRLGREGLELTQRLTSGLRPNPMLELHKAAGRLARGEMSEGEFLERFGHRCGGEEFELAAPRWREDAEALRAQVEQSRRAGDRSPARSARGEAARTEAEARLESAGREWGRVAREMVWTRLQTAQHLFPLRERCKDYLMMEFETLRAPLVSLDHRLDLDRGIFYLRTAEIGEAVRDPESVRRRIAERKREHRLCRQLQPPQILLGSRLDSPREAGPGLAGLGVSPGRARGRVRILRSADGLSAAGEGEILVVPSLEPTWTGAFLRAAALVAERGATLSHGAIVAREFGIPAVVNVPEATAQLSDGQELEVDGSAGTIRTI